MKYKLTNNKRECGRTLYQIEALKDFNDVKRGDLGGWIEKEDNLLQEGNCWVYDGAWVYGNAEVCDNAQIYGNAQVYGDAWVCGNAQVYGAAQVCGNAKVYENARVYGDAKVCGNVRVCENAQVCGDARVLDDAWVCGDARVLDDAWVYKNAYLSANLRYKKGSFIGGDDTGKITDITDKTGTNYWKAQYVLGDYEIEELEYEIEIDGKKYSKSTIKNALRDYIK